jgi:hypothetical protein
MNATDYATAMEAAGRRTRQGNAGAAEAPELAAARQRV